MSPPGDDRERPRWSFTWLLRVQRTGRNRRQIEQDAANIDADGVPKPRLFWRMIPWIIMLALGIEIAIGVWLDLLPR